MTSLSGFSELEMLIFLQHSPGLAGIAKYGIKYEKKNILAWRISLRKKTPESDHLQGR